MTEKQKRDTEKFYYCMNICPYLDRYYGWCNYNDTQDFDYKKCKIIRDKFKGDYK